MGARLLMWLEGRGSRAPRQTTDPAAGAGGREVSDVAGVLRAGERGLGALQGG